MDFFESGSWSGLPLQRKMWSLVHLYAPLVTATQHSTAKRGRHHITLQLRCAVYENLQRSRRGVDCLVLFPAAE